jgi:hypothetical protein
MYNLAKNHIWRMLHAVLRRLKKEDWSMNYRRGLVCLFLVIGLLGGGQAWGAAGDPLWQQTFNYLPNYDSFYQMALGASANTVIVCGEVGKNMAGNGYNSLGYIRAYDVASGAPKWQGAPLTLASTAGAYNDNCFDSIIINGNIAMVEGWAYSYTNDPGTGNTTVNLDKAIMWAYNADTGQLIWENITDNAGSYSYLYGANAITVTNKVFTFGCDNTGNAILRAYQIPSTYLQSPLLLLDDK